MQTLGYLFLSICAVLAQDDGPTDPDNHFIYPPLPGHTFNHDPSVFGSNLNFTVGVPQPQPFTWTSTVDNLSIMLWQEGNPDSVHSHTLTECGSSAVDSLYWDGDIGEIDLNNGSQAFLAAWDCIDEGIIFYSHYINLTKAEVSAITFPTASSTTVTPSATNTAGPSTTVPSPAEQSSTSPPPNEASVIGGGVGGGVAGALVVFIAGFAVMRYRKKRVGKNNVELLELRGHPGLGIYNAPPPPKKDEVTTPDHTHVPGPTQLSWNRYPARYGPVANELPGV
ncbi:hypothetical protein F5Y15DRAFT_412934 [Xylariaceae sp. FL0016]|nr:hypothetical protein F5Y15DRAFT_412934 [Xylariaceae sp. FL0016]